MTIIHLNLGGPLHQGEFTGINREKALDWVPSDSLFAALVQTWADQGEDVAQRLSAFEAKEGAPPFLLTSAFPFAGGVRFYPCPPLLPPHLSCFSDNQQKKAKKIRWLSEKVLHLLISGQDPSEDSAFLHKGSLWISASEKSELEKVIQKDDSGALKLWNFQIVPHVVVDRVSNASNLFHTGRVVFAPPCGIWFGVRGSVDWVLEALPHLEDSGLGGMRSSGHGAFTYRKVEQNLPEPDGGYGLLLSRYAPAELDEISIGLQAERSAYQMVTVGGWCQDYQGHPWRRRAVRLVAEGALLPVNVVQGKLVDVRPQNVQPWNGPQAIYRYGFAFMIPGGKLVEAL